MNREEMIMWLSIIDDEMPFDKITVFENREMKVCNVHDLFAAVAKELRCEEDRKDAWW